MLASILDRLACPTCQSAFAVQVVDAADDRIVTALLRCAACGTVTPLSHGFALFTETQINHPQIDEQWLQSKAADWFRSSDYANFLREKAARQLRDSYAFFQPFNESSRALLALLEALRRRLRPGDVILDTWCRTGWSGEWLASLFPQQQIISLWEGNSNVLGYAGFQYWLAEEQRSPNLSILFTHANKPLPLRDNAVQLVVGLDSLHRYDRETFLPECIRVAGDDDVLFFPHIHLTNSEPEPFFERGCLQLSGTEWEAILNLHCPTGSRKGFIFAEPELFDAGARFTLNSNATTQHYNGAALIAPQAWDQSSVVTAHKPDITGNDYLVLNALVDINLNEARVAISGDRPGFDVSELLLRHPVYQQRLEKKLGHDLSERECEVLFLSRRGLRFEQLCVSTQCDEQRLRATVQGLCEREIIFPAAVSHAMVSLQNYYGYLELPATIPGSFPKLWAELPSSYRQQPILLDEDGTCYDFESVEIMVRAAGQWLRGMSSHGDRIFVCGENCAEQFILIWACWLNGRVIVPVDAQAAPDTVADILASTHPVACFSDKPLPAPYYQFDSLAGEDDTGILFSDLLAPHVEDPEPAHYVGAPSDLAAILFTSGSTGKPKGVCLSQGSLVHSAHALVHHFQWPAAGVLLSLGAMHTMSGLRNPAVAALMRGMTILVPAPGITHPVHIYSLLSRHKVTHLSTVPSLLVNVEKLENALAAEQRPQSLQQIISTGYRLPRRTRAHLEQRLNVPVYSYYGLTETGGICLADATDRSADGDLGMSVEAVAQVRDATGAVLGPGHAGELCIYSGARASGYWGDNVTSSVRFDNGWVHTGDIVKLAADGSFHYIGRRDDQIKNRWGEILYLQEVEHASSALDTIVDCCCAVHASETGDMDTLILFIVLADASTESTGTRAVHAQLQAILGPRKLPEKIVAVPTIARFTNTKADRISMLALYNDREHHV